MIGSIEKQFKPASRKRSFALRGRNPQVGEIGMSYRLKPTSYMHRIENYQEPLTLTINKSILEVPVKNNVKTYTVKISDLFKEDFINKLDEGAKAIDLMSKSEKRLYTDVNSRIMIESFVNIMYEAQTKGFENKITPEFKTRYKEWLTLVTIRMFNEIPDE
jgi:hypothetical protein